MSDEKHGDRSSDRGDGLSERGRARREAMLIGLQREVTARGRRRRVVRAGMIGVPSVLAVGAAWIWFGRGVDRPGPSAIADSGGAAVGGGVDGPGDRGSTPSILAHAEAAGAPGSADSSDAGRGAEATDHAALLAQWEVVPRYRRGVNASSESLIARTTADGGLVRRVARSGESGIVRASDEVLAVGLRASGVAAGVVRTPEGVRVMPDGPGGAEGRSAG